MRENPDLAELSRNVIIDETPEGLRIQIVDQDGRSMFPSGHAEPFERTRKLLDEVAGILIKLPNRVSISGHTDANPVAGRPGYSNWELTADRANATRRILVPRTHIMYPPTRSSARLGPEPLSPKTPTWPPTAVFRSCCCAKPPSHRPVSAPEATSYALAFRSRSPYVKQAEFTGAGKT